MKRAYKFILLVLIIALVVGVLVYFITKNGGEKKASKDEIAISEKLAVNTITKLTYGYGTPYNGVDLLFEKDKYTYEDLSVGNILITAINYMRENDMNSGVTTTALDAIESKYGYSINEYSPYDGKVIRKAIKEIFGKDFTDQSTDEEINFGFDIKYIYEYDIYLLKQNNYYVEDNKQYSVVTEVLNTTVKDDKILTEIAVAYVYKDDKTYNYYANSKLGKAVFTSDKLENKLKEQDKFKKYIITLNKVNDNYVFESITKE